MGECHPGDALFQHQNWTKIISTLLLNLGCLSIGLGKTFDAAAGLELLRVRAQGSLDTEAPRGLRNRSHLYIFPPLYIHNELPTSPSLPTHQYWTKPALHIQYYSSLKVGVHTHSWVGLASQVSCLHILVLQPARIFFLRHLGQMRHETHLFECLQVLMTSCIRTLDHTWLLSPAAWSLNHVL